MIDESVGEVVAGVADIATDEVARRWGWKGCLIVSLLVAAIVAVPVWLLLR